LLCTAMHKCSLCCRAKFVYASVMGYEPATELNE